MRAALRSALLLAALIAPASAIAQPSETPAEPSVKISPALAPDVAFARQLAFIRADLLIADALVKERDWVDALPHAQFPREEVYGVIREDLRTYKVPPFDGALRALADAVRRRNAKGYQRALDKVHASLAAADKTLRARQADWPHFTLQVALATLGRAVEEYDDAVTNGRVRAIGYQSARGVVFEVARMIESVIDALEGKDVQAAEELRASVWRLKTLFEPLAPQKDAPADRPATVSALVADIQKSAARL